MKKNTSPLIWDLDAQGNASPTVTPGASPTGITFNVTGLPGRVEDMFPYAQALVCRVSFVVTQAASATALNADKLWQAVESFRFYSPVLGELLSQRSGQGAAVGQIDQVIGAGYKFPTPVRAQISSTAADYNVDLYYRIPLALDTFGRPQDGGIWTALLNSGSFTVNINATTASLLQTNASIKAQAATVRAWLEVLPMREAVVHAPSRFVRYEFNTSSSTLKLMNFGTGDGLQGVNPGARMSALFWLSNVNGLGGVDTVDKWTRLAFQARNQRFTQNPEGFMHAFHSYLGKRVGPVGSVGSGTVNDAAGWPYTMAGGPTNGVLDSSALFFPVVFPGNNSNLSGTQKLVGDIQIDAGFSSNPSGTHVFRTLEHYGFTASTMQQIVSAMGFDPTSYTLEPKTADNTDPALIDPKQLWGLPLRVVPRNRARVSVI